LFGHVRGAFTGATGDRAGLFELAGGGTLLLDEIGEAPPEVQAKLLRVLEAREITPVGAATPRPIDVRVVAATNRDLDAAVATGLFRADLFHRLNGFPLAMPPLADRLDDLPALVEWFLEHSGGPRPAITPAFLDALRCRRWPGNVRELRHAIAYATVVARGAALAPDHLPAASPAGPQIPSGPPAEQRVQDAVRAWVAERWPDEASGSGDLHERLLACVETTIFDEALARTAGNRTAAARLLGVDRATLRAKIDR
ncbi:MAG: sigma-54-dependent Fis family transcriptional regulator, partial [Planctomycetia bacterium]|nr:sigma-54-dependent Fis family transcriptional regulator [Planctomycetia bacterium]